MDSVASIISITATAFVATNLDNLILLITWLVEPAARKSSIAVGLVGGVAIILLTAYGIGWMVDTAAVDYLEYLGYLGFVPLSLGVFKLIMLWRGQASGTDAQPIPLATLGYVTTQLANGGDTIAVFAPLLIDTQQRFDWLIPATIAVLVAVWFVLACILAQQARRLQFLQKHAQWLAALVMIVVGLYILADTPADIVGSL